jgi:magnesium-transporting ATPase (P-type)
MLTGDKLETAENIGKSCNLIQKNMKVITLNGREPKELLSQIYNARELIDLCFANNIPKCLLIEGETLGK